MRTIAFPSTTTWQSTRRLVASLVVLLIAAATLTVAGAPAARAATINTSAEYVLVNRHSGLAADVLNASTQNGAEIIQWHRTDAAWQRWRFVDAGSGYYRIVSAHSGKAIDVWERSTANGAEIRQYTDTGSANQQWRPVDTNGGVQLVNRHSGKSLEVWERSTAPAARLSQYTSSGGANQVWDLVPVGDSQGSAECGTGTYTTEAVQSGSTWTARRGGTTLYSGSDMVAAVRAAVGGLTAGRTSQERVVVRGSGSMPASTSIDLPSHTSLEVCGTIDVTGSATASNAPIRIRHARNVSVPHLNLTGAPYFGIWVRTSSDVHLGQIDLRLSGGLGIRVDSRDNDAVREARNIRIDDVYVSGSGAHGVETYGVDGLTIGTVTARNTGYSGLLLNDTVNATVGRVDGNGAGTGTGYAAFRMANRNGSVAGSYPTNIRVGEVVARGGGRGIFCVSQSGGVVIDRVDIANTGGDSILIENCYNVTIASQGGTVSGPGGIRIAARSEFANTRDVTFSNLTLNSVTLRESPCAVNTRLSSITWNNSSNQTC
ncbi:RICIN domain-containing protein [Isoptericola croceus]|uniref:RICIN domain-containing protein n=1 Tax=Isoptericola croceus TaxID=3031406 RepID=UPI0023F977E7|nr:RICIN domain-containing protein [Isoptericola croceus]